MRYGSLQLLGKFGIELGFLQLLLHKVRIDNPWDEDNQQREIEHLAPNGEIPRRKHWDIERINLVSDIALAIQHMNGEMIITIRQTIIRDVEIALIQIVPLVVTAFQTISINGCRMIGKRKVGELKGKAIFITLQYQSLQAYRRNSRSSLDAFIKQGILCLPSIHHDTRQEQLCLFIHRHI